MIAALAFLLFLADDHLRSGLMALQRGDLRSAQTELEAASQNEPLNPRVWLGLAQTYWKLDQPQRADSAAARAAALGREDVVVLRALLLYYSERGDSAKIAQVGQEMIRLRPQEETCAFDVAQALLRFERFNQALDILNGAIKRFPQSAQLELTRGVALYGLRRFPESIESFLRTIRLAPDVPQPYVFLGRVLHQAEGKLPQIVQVFSALQNSDPRNYLANLLYAKGLIVQSGDSPRAESLLRDSIALKSDYWESHFELGLLLSVRHSFEAAAAELEKAIALNPREPTAHYHLARVYDRLGKTSAAEAERALHARLSHEEAAGGMQSPPAPPVIK